SLEGVPESVRRRIVEKDGVRRFILEEAGRSASGSHIFLDQWDVRKLQSAKAAVMAGANILLREAGIEWGELETVFLAGAFGAHLRSGRAARIGLIPPLPEDRVRIVHNAAASGGRLALLSREKLAQAAELKVMTRNVELAGHPEFQDAFVQAIPFPGA
ncbi:MAG: ASKHA domain-containing protein, partial [Nitrospinota bacterium]|nr:ASKHA domain-containing protein [Nitrospinota bacterium]